MALVELQLSGTSEFAFQHGSKNGPPLNLSLMSRRLSRTCYPFLWASTLCGYMLDLNPPLGLRH